MDCVFCKIRDRIIPKEFIYEDEDVMVFPDIHPIKPVHLLIIPKRHIEDLLMIDNPHNARASRGEPHFAKASTDAKAMADKSRGEERLMMKVVKTAQMMVKKFKLEGKGYRLGINGGGAQIINHVHFHLLGPLSKTASM